MLVCMHCHVTSAMSLSLAALSLSHSSSLLRHILAASSLHAHTRVHTHTHKCDIMTVWGGDEGLLVEQLHVPLTFLLQLHLLRHNLQKKHTPHLHISSLSYSRLIVSWEMRLTTLYLFHPPTHPYTSPVPPTPYLFHPQNICLGSLPPGCFNGEVFPLLIWQSTEDTPYQASFHAQVHATCPGHESFQDFHVQFLQREHSTIPSCL